MGYNATLAVMVYDSTTGAAINNANGCPTADPDPRSNDYDPPETAISALGWVLFPLGDLSGSVTYDVFVQHQDYYSDYKHTTFWSGNPTKSLTFYLTPYP